MSKTIKLEDSVYTRLENFRGKRETFSQAVDLLLTIRDKVGMLRDVLEGSIKFREFEANEPKKSPPTH